MLISCTRFFQRIISLILCLFVWSTILSIAAPSKLLAFSVGEEREAGEQILAFARENYPFLDDPDITQYINRLGRSILTTSGPQYFNYHFHVIKNKEFNAFAAPAGLIFIHSGLIEAMETEGELFGVLAHEIGHSTKRHIAQGVEKSQKISIGTLAMVLMGVALGSGKATEAVIAGSLAAGASMQLHYSRQHEEEADRLAYKWMLDQSRNPADMASMIAKMRKISMYSQGEVPPYLLTHPEPEKRLGYVQDLIHLQQKTAYRVEDNFDFLRLKARVLSMTKSPETLMPRYLGRISDKEKKGEKELFAYFGLSQTYLANADFVQSRKALSYLMTEYPGKPILLTDMGVTYYQEGKFQNALELFEQAFQQNRECAYTSFNLAQAHEQTGNPEKALAYYESLLTQLPEYPRLHYKIGQLKAGSGNKPVGHYHFGAYYWFKGDVKNAEFHLKQALSGLADSDPARKTAENLLAAARRIKK